jgi:hypothetical protein
MATPPTHDTWDPAAYILRGQYCPKPIIRSTLADVMGALGGTRIIHIAFDEQTVITGLCFTQGYQEHLGTKIEKLVSRAVYKNPNTDISELCRQVASKTHEETMIISPPLVKDLVNAVAQLRLRRSSLSTQERGLFVNQAYSGMYLNTVGNGHDAGSGGIKSVILVDASFRSVRFLRHTKKLSELAVQLNSTPEATARNDRAVMRQVAERLHTADNEGEATSFERFASDALVLALDVTRSQGGAVYTISSERSTSLSLIASNGDLPFPNSLPHDNAGALGAVMSSNKALQLHRWPLPSTGKPARRGPDGTVLLTPVGGPGGDPMRPAIGALILYRSDSDSSFNAYDLALTRNVTLRMALARTTDVMARIGSVTTALRATTDWVRILGRLHDDDDIDFADVQFAIPTDIRAAALRIGPALRNIAKLTDSLSVTLRLALPVAAVEQDHGLALVRVASYPRKTHNDKYAVQTESMGGLNWKCMRTGDAVYESAVRSSADFISFRPGTVSEFSLPIRLEGMVVGTLNLESSLHDAYSPFRPLISSFGGAVGRTLADARASLEQRVIDSAAQALNHRHSMDKRLVDLSHAIEIRCTDQDAKVLFTGLVRRIDEELDAMRRLPSFEDEPETTLDQILQRSKRHVQYLGPLPDSADYPILTASITKHRVKPLEVTITNILSNMMAYTATARDEMPFKPLREIKVSKTELQGVEQAVLIFANYADGYLDPGRIADLYRGPVQDAGGRLRVGAFLAGLNARRSAARLHCGVLSDHRTLIATLVIPLEG